MVECPASVAERDPAKTELRSNFSDFDELGRLLEHAWRELRNDDERSRPRRRGRANCRSIEEEGLGRAEFGHGKPQGEHGRYTESGFNCHAPVSGVQYWTRYARRALGWRERGEKAKRDGSGGDWVQGQAKQTLTGGARYSERA